MKNQTCFRSIDEWKSSITMLPDQNFFELLKCALGNIKTPFNKQRLMEDLFSFLLQEDIQKTIASYIDDNDQKIIAAIALLQSPVAADLETFFSGELSYGELHSQLRNLEERLIIYRFEDKKNRFISLNPALKNILEPLTKKTGILFPSLQEKPSDNAKKEIAAPFYISDNRIMAALLKYLETEGQIFKTEGSLRRKTKDDINRLFPTVDIETFTGILDHLDLFNYTEEAFIPDRERIADFCRLDSYTRRLFWSAALYLYLDEKSGNKKAIPVWETSKFLKLKEIAVLMYKFISLLDSARLYPKITLNRCAFLINRKNTENALWNSFTKEDRKIFRPEILLDTLEKCGLLSIQDNLYYVIRDAEKEFETKEKNTVIAMDSAFSFILYPDISLEDAVSLSDFCALNDNGTFTLTCSSAIKYFDRGYDSNDIIDLIKRLSGGRFDNNLEWTLADWESRYSSISLYHGEVLVLKEDRHYLAQTKPLASLIQKTLAPGVYLLFPDSKQRINYALRKVGVDIFSQPERAEMGTGLTSSYKRNYFSTLDSPDILLSSLKEILISAKTKTASKNIPDSTAILKKRFNERLNKLKLSDTEREELSARIERKLILSEDLLETSSIRYEKLEARGLDYTGKILLAKQSIATGSILEVTWPETRGIVKTATGIPLSLEKEGGESILVLKLNEIENLTLPEEIRLPLRKISRLRRIKQSIFEESSVL